MTYTRLEIKQNTKKAWIEVQTYDASKRCWENTSGAKRNKFFTHCGMRRRVMTDLSGAVK
jgi:hypothetical protein